METETRGRGDTERNLIAFYKFVLIMTASYPRHTLAVPPLQLDSVVMEKNLGQAFRKIKEYPP